MKLTTIIRSAILASALSASIGSASAQLSIVDPNYSTTSIYTDTDSNSIVSYDWDAAHNLYYQTAVTSDFSFNLGGFYKVTPSGTTSTIMAGGASNVFAGANVVSIGGNIYFNDNTFNSTTFASGYNIYQYNTTDGLSLTSTATNYGISKGPGNSMYITAASGGSDHIYYSSSANLASAPPLATLDLGAQNGNSGPLAFDAEGNLYYAPGFGNLSIFKWTSAQVAAALANPGVMADQLVTGNAGAGGNAQLWLDYSSIYSPDDFGGGTSLLINGDKLLLTVTEFASTSVLASFGIDSSTGTYVTNSSDTILSDASGLLGELRTNNGNLYLSDGNQIYLVSATPEPSSLLLLALGMGALFYVRSRKVWRLVPAFATTVFFSR